MKKSLFKFVILFLFTVLINGNAFSANEYFRSVASGNWNSNSTWEMSLNNATWFPATSTPGDTSNTITVRSPNTVTVTVSVSADQLVVENGGTISINAAILLTLKDGTGTDLTLNGGGTISGAGTFQTQGAGVTIINRANSNFTAAFKVNTGVTTSNDDGSPYIAIYKGSMTVDAGATLNTQGGSYSNQGNGNVTNNGTIAGNRFIMNGGTLTNNSSIAPATLEFNDTTSLAGTGTYTANAILIGGTGNVSLANNLSFSPAGNFTINNGGVLNPNTRTFTFKAGTFYLNSGGTTVNSGIFQTQGSVQNIIRSGSNFNAPFKVNTGTTTSNDDSPPYIANYKGTMTIDAGAILTTPGGSYSSSGHGAVTNNGTITGNNFIVDGPTISNTGTITSSNLTFDTVTTATGAGSYSSNTILISGTGNLSLLGSVTFSPGTSFTINSGGRLTPSGETFTFNSGSFILNSGAIVAGTGVSAGTLRSQGTVNFIFRNGSTFNSGINVNSGTLTSYDDAPPYIGIFRGGMFINTGATLNTPGGGYTAQANGNVNNFGTISGNKFSMRGALLTNNGSITVTNFQFDSTTALAGTGTYTSSAMVIGGTGNVSLSNNVTVSPTSTFTILNGGILNPNTRIFNFNAGTFYANNSSNILNSGTFQTQNSVNLIIKAGANFSSPLKVNTGTTTSYDDSPPYIAIYKGTITVDAGATLQNPAGGFTIQSNGNVTNNGTILANSGAIFRMRGAVLTNNSAFTGSSLSFDSVTTLAGTGSYSNAAISIGGTGNVSLSNNVTFNPGSTFTINNGGILNPTASIFTLASGSLVVNSGGTVQSTGTFRTQGSVNLIVKSGSNFNGSLKVNTGTAVCYDDSPPYIGVLNGTVTIDTGAVLTTPGGGYTMRLNNSVTNNGTLSNSSGAAVRFFGTSLTNNGTVTALAFNFESGAHNLLGTGSWSTNANVLTGATVTLTSNHKMYSMTISAGGTFNVSTFKLSLTGSSPIGNSGTFNTSSGTVEYNGTIPQSISTTNITYNRLRINNSAGTSIAGNVTVNDTLSDILGHLNLNGFVLTISPTGYLTETPGNTINGTSGYITTTRTLNAPSGLNVGGLGAVLTTAVNLGSTEIRRGHAVQNGLNGNTSILRYFDITPTTNTGLNGTLVYKYDDSELNGKTEGALSLFRSINTGSTWTAQGGTVNVAANTITLSGIGAFSRWSASSAAFVAAQIKVIIEGYYDVSTNRLNIRDTVRAYLRNITPPYAVVDSALSVIDSVTFSGNFNFMNAVSGTYYIQTKQRNSIETWSKSGGQAYVLGNVLSYDFTTSAAQAFGNNEVQKGSKFCIFSGDILQDGFVDLQDLVLVFNDASNFATGYVKTDLTGDRIVDLTDIVIAFNNASAFVHSVTP